MELSGILYQKQHHLHRVSYVKHQKTKYVCNYILICADKCAADKIFDCKTKTCQCPANTKICGSDGICCTTCNNDVCCTEEQQITNQTYNSK